MTLGFWHSWKWQMRKRTILKDKKYWMASLGTLTKIAFSLNWSNNPRLCKSVKLSYLLIPRKRWKIAQSETFIPSSRVISRMNCSKIRNSEKISFTSWWLFEPMPTKVIGKKSDPTSQLQTKILPILSSSSWISA